MAAAAAAAHLLFSISLVLLTLASTAAHASTNLTLILESAGYFTKFLGLASSVNVTSELQAFIDAPGTSGVTLFAPTDDAFTPGVVTAYTGLAAPQQKLLLQYHGLPKFRSYSDLVSTRSRSIVNVQTFAPSLYLNNITVLIGHITVYASVNYANVTSNYATDFPLTVFAINAVLLPAEIFGNATVPPPPPPPSAPAPAPSNSTTSPSPASSLAPATAATPPSNSAVPSSNSTSTPATPKAAAPLPSAAVRNVLLLPPISSLLLSLLPVLVHFISAY